MEFAFYWPVINDGGGCASPNRSCQIFLGKTYQNGKNIPNDHKRYQKAIKYILFCRKVDKMAIKIPTSSFARPSKIYPNWDFWFENIPSGNTGLNVCENLFSGERQTLAKQIC
jgi:hypothetical protein